MQINCENVIDLNHINIEDLNERKLAFYLDTNIWYWLTYPDSNTERLSDDYAHFVNEIHLAKDTKILYSHLTFAELTNIIEREKLNSYKRDSGNQHISKKQYRQLIDERNNVVEDIEISLNQITRIGESDEAFVEVLNYIKKDDFIKTLQETTLDGTDILMANFIKQNGVQNIITNDRDYLTIRGVNIFTFDLRVINTAQCQGYNTDFRSCFESR